jgi:glycosyltransferase involved in cell wall biosynthesis
MKDSLIRAKIKENKISVIPTPIKSSFFDDIDLKSTQSTRNILLERKFDRIIMYVGRLTRAKNLSFLIKTFANIIKDYPRVRLILVGEGEERSLLEKLANNLNLADSVLFVGPIRHELLPIYYSACDVFVFTSFGEGRANVLIEAALSKKPIISTDVGVAHELIINGKTGFIINQNDAGDLKDKVLYLLNNQDLAKLFGIDMYNYLLSKAKEDDSKNFSDLLERSALLKQ